MRKCARLRKLSSKGSFLARFCKIDSRPLLIQPHQKNASLRRFCISRDLFSPRSEVILNSHPYPPGSGGAAECQDLSRAIAPSQVISDLSCPILPLEASQLNCPT